MKRLRNAIQPSLLAVLVLSASAPLTVLADTRVPYVRDMTQASRESSEWSGIQSITEITPQGPQAARTPFVRDIGTATLDNVEGSGGVRSAADISLPGAQLARVRFVRDIRTASREDAEMSGIQSARDIAAL